MPTFDQFREFDIRVGTIVSARAHPTSRKPSFQLEVHFGPVGLRQSSAQLTKRYRPEQLVGRQVVAVLNFPPRRVGDFTSDVLVLGAMVGDDDVLLLAPDGPTPDGTRIA